MNNYGLKSAQPIMKNPTEIPAGDYISQGLQVVIPDEFFPNMILGDKASHPWPYLRRCVEHNWYCDRRAPQVGFLNRDEAVLLYNLALPFSGKPALEIGCWMGWSTCHLALAGVALDSVDPVLRNPENAASVRDSLRRAGVLQSVRLYTLSSPEGIKHVADLTGSPWNFFFIDGDHEAAAPERDARECLVHAAADAMVVFHDLASPNVERGLDVFRQEGWETLIYQTMQIMGCAWRGNVKPVCHIPDPSVVWSLPAHLAKYRVSGASVESELSRLSQLLSTIETESAKWKVESTRLQIQLSARETEMVRLQAEVSAQESETARLQAELDTQNAAIKSLRTDLAKSKAAGRDLARSATSFEAALNSVRDSRSWKITAPLRASKRAIFRLIPPRGAGVPKNTKVRTGEAVVSAPTLKRAVQWLPKPCQRLLVEAYRKRAILKSGLFDAEYYLAQNPEVAKKRIDPLRHYLMIGAAEGRDPSPRFDTSFYLEIYRDVAEARVNPLAHYVTRGVKEGRYPQPPTSAFSVSGGVVPPSSRSSPQGVPGNGFSPVCAPVVSFEADVCIVTPDIVGPVKNGGIGTACYHFARALAEAGQAVTILFTGDLTDDQKTHWRRVYDEMQISFIALSDTEPEKHPVWGSSWFLERSWRVFQFLRDTKVKVIHFQDWQANGFWSIKAKRVGLAFNDTILTVMTQSCTKWINDGMQQFGADPFETAKLIWAETYSIENCDVLLSPSQYMLSWLAENQIRCPDRKVLTPYVYTDREASRSRDSIQVDNDHLIFFGRLETRKGLHVFADALRLLRRDGGELPRRVSFVGKHASVFNQPSSDYVKQLKNEFKGIQFRVLDEFDHEEALRYIRESRGLVIIPSLVDNYPLTVLECIENAIPFFAAATGGIPEMIDERISFEPTAPALAKCLAGRNIIDHSQMNHKYSAAHAKDAWLNLHHELLGVSNRGDGERRRMVLEGGKVSVCIPFFNLEKYLETLALAFSKQRYPNFEVIFVNDGSSVEASREFDRIAAETRDARFRFFTTDNKGVGPARNFAAEQATGELLLFFDADNLPKNDHFIATLVRALEHSGVDCVTCPYDVVDADRVLPTDANIVSTYRPLGPCLEAGIFENYLGDSTMIIYRNVLLKMGGWSSNRASWDDWELLLNLCFRGFKLETVPDSLFYYRFRTDSMNRQHNLYLNYTSLFGQLKNAPAADLARITKTVVGPMLLQRNPELASKIMAR